MVFIRDEIGTAGGALLFGKEFAVGFSALRVAGPLQGNGALLPGGIGLFARREIGLADLQLGGKLGGLSGIADAFQ